MKHYQTQEDNLALSADVCRRNNIRINQILHLAAMPAVENNDSLEDFLYYVLDDEGDNGVCPSFREHRLPQVRHFYRRVRELKQVGYFERGWQEAKVLINLLNEVGMRGFLLEASRPLLDSSWGVSRLAFFYGESYEEALVEAMQWADSHVPEVCA